MFGIRRTGIVYKKIWLSECPETGRGGYSDTKEDALNYAGTNAKLTRAYKAYFKGIPEVQAFGSTKKECYTRLMDAMKHVTGAG